MEHLDFVSLFFIPSVLDTWQGPFLLPATTFLFSLVNVYSFFQTQIVFFLYIIVVVVFFSMTFQARFPCSVLDFPLCIYMCQSTQET